MLRCPLRLVEQARLAAVEAAQAAVNTDDGANVAIANRLQATLVAVQGLCNDTILGANVIGTCIVTAALQELADAMLPNKILQCVKCYLRREA